MMADVQDQIEEELLATPQDSDSKVGSNKDRVIPKTKPVKKNQKSKTQNSKPLSLQKSKSLHFDSSSSTMAPFSLFQSDQQKLRRLEIYFKEDIENYYRKSISGKQINDLQNIVRQNLVSLREIYRSDLNEIWKQSSIFVGQLISYFDLISKCRDFNNQYTLFQDRQCKKHYCCFKTKGDEEVYEISELEAELLKKRRNYKHFMGQNEKVSELSQEIVFLFTNLYSLSNNLQKKFDDLEFRIKKEMEEEKPETLVEDEYSAYLVCKLFTNSFKNPSIDYYNYFKNNERSEYGYEEGTLITEAKEFEEYMKKKKNKKGKKGRYVLHTACLGCFSSFHEQYNSFSNCQQCYMRFHRLCYSPKEEGYCEQCYHKKNSHHQKAKLNECQICPSKGLLSLSYKKQSTEHYIHIFCMVVNNLWKMEKGKLAYDNPNSGSNMSFFERELEEKENKKCSICSSYGEYLLSCENCLTWAHPSCAFLGGWDFEGDIVQGNRLKVKMRCCGNVELNENTKRRKFISNYKRYAYAYSLS